MKCNHDACKREAVDGSEYCNQCIQLPTMECNYCDGGLPENAEMRKLAAKIQTRIDKPWWKFW